MVKKRCTQKLLTELLHKIYMLFLLELIVTLEAVNSKKKKTHKTIFYLCYFTLLAKSKHKNTGPLLLRKDAFAVRLFQLVPLHADIAAYESFPLLLPALQAKQVKDWKKPRI